MTTHPTPDPVFAQTACHDVAIIGYGPAGATLANLLALRGLSVLVLEREPDIYRLPRAIHFDGECMRTFQTIGLADALRPNLIVSPGMKFVNAQGRVLIDYTRSVELGPQAWHPSYRFHQPQLEETLRAHAVSRPGVQVRLRHDVFSIEPAEEGVRLRLEDAATGRLLSTNARFVVGCDGARSLVRRFMGTELEDLQSHEQWVVLDVLLRRDRPDLGDHSIQYCDPQRPATYVRGVGARRRWEIMLMPGDDPSTITRPESVWPLLARWITPEDGVIERPALYTFHSVVAKGWRKGRLLIAGDAAHQTPPFMGQGMCAGIRDVINLAWKLADVVQGHADAELLDTYESERSPHVREFIEAAVRFGHVIQATDPDVVRRRDAEMASNPQVFRTPEPALGPGAHQAGRWGGRIVAQPIDSQGRRFDDGVGFRYALVARPELLAGTALVSGPRLNVTAAYTPALSAWLDTLGCAAVLLRPDRYVAGTADDAHAMVSLLAAAGLRVS